MLMSRYRANSFRDADAHPSTMLFGMESRARRICALSSALPRCRVAALRNGGDGDMRVEHERVGALPHEEATEILHAITLNAVTLRSAIDRLHTGTINRTQQTP